MKRTETTRNNFYSLLKWYNNLMCKSLFNNVSESFPGKEYFRFLYAQQIQLLIKLRKNKLQINMNC